MNKRQIIKIHIGFWILINLILFIAEYVSITERDNFHIAVSYYSVDRLFTIAIFYIFYYFTTPKIISGKKKFLYVLLGIIILLIFSLPSSYVLGIVTYQISDKFGIFERFKAYIPQEIINLFIFALFGSLFKFIFIWYDSMMKEKELEKQNISSELALLRAQINPHFFFNTLNNIKSFTITNPDKTLHIIDKLSETMSYILYESNIGKVELKKEIEFIKSYIVLQKIRYDSPDFIELNIDDSDSNILIPPLLFIPFIENAFKHGNKLVSPPGIIINLDVDDYIINFSVSNYTKEDDGIIRSKGGFGLSNIIRRLDLLFLNNYKLDISNDNNKFIINLIIHLNDN